MKNPTINCTRCFEIMLKITVNLLLPECASGQLLHLKFPKVIDKEWVYIPNVEQVSID